jgi:L-alanine-DL-glutamate epimerase-like enolase superfamily enzyme
VLRELTVRGESWPLAAPFRISRGTKVAAEVVAVEIREGAAVGRGESVPYARYGETLESVLAQVRGIEGRITAGLSREDLQQALPPGAARNALDCALWDLSARLSGRSVTARLGAGPLPALDTAVTLSLDTPARMGEAAARLAGTKVIKVKVDADDPAARLRAVHAAAPGARLIVDPNESWTPELVRSMQPVLVETGVALLEQPLPAGQDEALEGFSPLRPICADESCHVAADLPRLVSRYQAVNIKLDKTGGLTGALELLEAARSAGFLVMVGCMVCTSLGIAPAFHVARHADFVDLDGPLWLKTDRPDGARLAEGKLLPHGASLWGADGAG